MNVATSKRKVAIIVSHGGLDEVYPGLILGNAARQSGIDAFLFFTDGVYEAANRSGEEIGLARIEKILRTHVYQSTPQILDAIIKGIHEFADGEPVADDICLVVVDVTTDLAKS